MPMRRAVIAIALLVLTAGCSAAQAPPSTSSPTSVANVTTTAAASTSVPGPSPSVVGTVKPTTITLTTTTTTESVEVAWVPPGPVGITAPTGYCRPRSSSATASTASTASTSAEPASPNCIPITYSQAAASPAWTAAFTSRDCAAIGALGNSRTVHIYRGLSEACAALGNDDAAGWESAKQELAGAGSTTECADRLALQLLRSLVRAHDEKPAARIRIVDSTVRPELACQ